MEASPEEGGNFAWYQGMKIAIFDVTDVANPKEMHKVEIGDRGTDSYALNDHKAFLFDREKNLLVLPVLLAELTPEQKAAPGRAGQRLRQLHVTRAPTSTTSRSRAASTSRVGSLTWTTLHS